MSITDKTIVSTDVSVAGHVIFNTQLNAAAGFTQLYPKIVILEGLAGYNEYLAAVSYDLANYNAMVEIMCSTSGSLLSYYKMYNYISATGDGQSSGLVEQQSGINNSASIFMAISITNLTVLNVQFQQTAINDGGTFIVKITAWGRL